MRHAPVSWCDMPPSRSASRFGLLHGVLRTDVVLPGNHRARPAPIEPTGLLERVQLPADRGHGQAGLRREAGQRHGEPVRRGGRSVGKGQQPHQDSPRRRGQVGASDGTLQVETQHIASFIVLCGDAASACRPGPLHWTQHRVGSHRFGASPVTRDRDWLLAGPSGWTHPAALIFFGLAAPSSTSDIDHMIRTRSGARPTGRLSSAGSASPSANGRSPDATRPHGSHTIFLFVSAAHR